MPIKFSNFVFKIVKNLYKNPTGNKTELQDLARKCTLQYILFQIFGNIFFLSQFLVIV